MNNFDYDKLYYKITNKKERHNGYQYYDGLNVLNEEFNDNPSASCVRGRLYFTDYENMPRYFTFGINIREVRIPRDAKIIGDPKGNKWGADRLILGKKYSIKRDFSKWFDADRYNWIYDCYLVKYCNAHKHKWEKYLNKNKGGTNETNKC